MVVVLLPQRYRLVEKHSMFIKKSDRNDKWNLINGALKEHSDSFFILFVKKWTVSNVTNPFFLFAAWIKNLTLAKSNKFPSKWLSLKEGELTWTTKGENAVFAVLIDGFPCAPWIFGQDEVTTTLMRLIVKWTMSNRIIYGLAMVVTCQ